MYCTYVSQRSTEIITSDIRRDIIYQQNGRGWEYALTSRTVTSASVTARNMTTTRCSLSSLSSPSRCAGVSCDRSSGKKVVTFSIIQLSRCNGVSCDICGREKQSQNLLHHTAISYQFLLHHTRHRLSVSLTYNETGVRILPVGRTKHDIPKNYP